MTNARRLMVAAIALTFLTERRCPRRLNVQRPACGRRDAACSAAETAALVRPRAHLKRR